MRNVVCAIGILSTLFFVMSVSSADMPYEYISFDDLTPSNRKLTQCWDHIGKDDNERIYIGFTSNCDNGLEDVCMFRYTPVTGKREFLGTFMTAAKSAENYRSGESIPKGHTDIVNIDGVLYMGSQGFHDWKGDINTLNTFRGGHIFTFTTATSTWGDASKSLPGGVVIEHEGIICIEPLPWNNLLVALTHPHSTIIIFDYSDNTVFRVVSGIPWKLGNPLSRELVVTRTGKIYTYRGTENPEDRDKSFNIWQYDIIDNTFTKNEFTCSNGFWDGQAKTHNGDHIYVTTCNGNLYHLDVASDTWEFVGHFLPKEQFEKGDRHTYLYGICLSPDERYIYSIASMSQNTRLNGNLYEYNRQTGTIRLVQSVGGQGCYTGNDVRDAQGNIYFARHGNNQDGWNYNCRLLKITVAEPLAADAAQLSTRCKEKKIQLSCPSSRQYLLNGRLMGPARFTIHPSLHFRNRTVSEGKH